jgi:Leucine-rich repeat (LRR) protein
MPPAPKHSRRWFSYSLRSLFVIVTLAAIGVAWVASERRQSRDELEIAEQLRAAGGSVRCCGAFDPDDKSLEPPWWRKALSGLYGPRIQCVIFGDSRSTFCAVPLLSGLKHVRVLILNRTHVEDISPLAGCTRLRTLSLDITGVTDLSPLSGLVDLEEITLRGTQVRDVTPLGHLQHLKTLDLLGTKISDIAPLAGCKSLIDLDVKLTAVSKEQVTILREALPNCEVSYLHRPLSD